MHSSMTFYLCAVNRDMDDDLDQFDDTDDELLSSLPLSFPFEDPSAGLENKPRPKEEDKNGEGVTTLMVAYQLLLVFPLVYKE